MPSNNAAQIVNEKDGDEKRKKNRQIIIIIFSLIMRLISNFLESSDLPRCDTQSSFYQFKILIIQILG